MQPAVRASARPMSNLASALPNFTHYQAAGVTPVRLLLAYAFLALGPTQAGAATLDWGATLRTRFESKQDFDFDNSSQDYLLTQARLRLEVEGSAGNFLIELQDARIGGESRSGAPPINEDTAPNVFADRLDLHQAYWEYSSNNSRIRVGRQKLNLGDNRLVASLEWVNTARVHDGVRLTVGNAETRSIDAFATALVAVKPDRFNDQASVGNRYLDSQFHGAFVTDRASLPGAELQYWYFYSRVRLGAGTPSCSSLINAATSPAKIIRPG
jgi:hypothetical protein